MKNHKDNNIVRNTGNVPPSILYPKTIYLIRHGIAAHNMLRPDGSRQDYLDPQLTDAPLVQQGEWQASQLGQHFSRLGLVLDVNKIDHDEDDDEDDDDDDDECMMEIENDKIDMILCSPLTRCIQTASFIFPTYFRQRHDAAEDGRVCCHGGLREAFGKHYPDRRSSLSHIKSLFPNILRIHQPSLRTEHDVDWKPNQRETYEDVSARVHDFFSWLLLEPLSVLPISALPQSQQQQQQQQPSSSRSSSSSSSNNNNNNNTPKLRKTPSKHVAIVSHGVWIECALHRYCPHVLEGGKKRVYNCNVFRAQLTGQWVQKHLNSAADGGRDNQWALDVQLTNVQQLQF